MTPPDEYREGPPRLFVPVCVLTLFGFIGGPIGWVEVDEVAECPVVIPVSRQVENGVDVVYPIC